MGILKGLLQGLKGGPEAVRYNLRLNYQQGYENAKRSGAEEDDCIQSGLVHALTMRYKARFQPIETGTCFKESVPFALLPKEEGADALIEYIVWKDYPNDVNIDNLSIQITRGFTNAVKELPKNLLSDTLSHGFPWMALLRSTDTEGIQTVGKLDKSMTNEAIYASKLRSAAREAYDEGHRMAARENKTEKQQHETALVNVLLRKLQAGPSALPVSELMIQALMMEILPFNVINMEEGRNAMIEYIVWRECKNEANEDLLKAALKAAANAMERRGSPDFLDGLKRAPFEWVELLN